MNLTDFLIKNFGIEQVLATVIIIGAALIIGISIHFIAYRILRRLERRSENPNIHTIRTKTKFSTLILFIVLVLMISIPVLEISPKVYDVIKHILNVMLILNLGWLAIVAVDVAENLIVGRFDMTSKDNLKARKISTQLKVFERILIVIIAVFTISVVLMTFEGIRQLGTSLLASAGIAGIIIGFAAQRSIATIIAGVQIALTQPIRLEDVVIVEKEWGWIEEITLTYVVVRIWDLRRLVVPINYFIEKPFQNWTRKSADILGTVFIYTDYNVPFDALREELTRLLKASKHWDGKVNVLQVTDAKQDTIEVRALMSSVDSPTNWDLRVYIREKLIEFLQKNYPDSLPRTRVIFPDSKKASEQAVNEKI